MLCSRILLLHVYSLGMYKMHANFEQVFSLCTPFVLTFICCAEMFCIMYAKITI